MSDMLGRLSAALGSSYRIERELGAGGMATVYLAQDLKHDRKVAIKVLKPELAVAIGAERFLAEIKTTANLQHPHILALHDSGEVNGTVFYVMPFVDGESLRDRLDREKQLPIDDALRIAGEVADALQYAHERGVVHRDIKPENILLQRGHAVVADFGIALAASKTGGSRMTETGMSLGTPTYMSPEQAMGAREVDARTDIYSLGCVVYEMLMGAPPFVGPTAQSIVAKVMTEAPRGLTAQRHTVPAHVDAAVRTALEKLAADRFASAGAFAAALRDSTTSTRIPNAAAVANKSSRGTVIARWSAATLLGVVALAAVYLWGRQSTTSGSLDAVEITQRTFRRQSVFTARYTASGDAIVFSGAESGTSLRIYTVGSAYPEPRSVSDSGTHLLAVSSRNEMAVLVDAKLQHHRVFVGTLARMPVDGGAPREILAGVSDADWSPDGTQLAIIHEVTGKDRLEYPIGTVLYETAGSLTDIRVAPDGQHIAFHEHPEKGDDRGTVAMVDITRVHTLLTASYWGLQGLAWTPDGERINFGGSVRGGFDQLYEVSLRSATRTILPATGNLTLQDVARDGRRLLTRDDTPRRMWWRAAGDTAATNVSWLDGTVQPVISGDGLLLAFTDVSSQAGPSYASMLRRADGTNVVRLGSGFMQDLSRDKQWIISTVPVSPAQLMLYPTGAGTSRRLDHGEFESITRAAFVADGRQILICGNEPKRAIRCYVRPIVDGPLRAVTPEGVNSAVVSPDGAFLVAATADSGHRRYAISSGASFAIPGMLASEQVLRFSPDGKSLWTLVASAVPVRITQVDLATGARSPLTPAFVVRRPGLLTVRDVTLADDPRNYAYVEREFLCYVFEVKGLR